jgi:hypothetical protein
MTNCTVDGLTVSLPFALRRVDGFGLKLVFQDGREVVLDQNQVSLLGGILLACGASLSAHDEIRRVAALGSQPAPLN